MSVSAQIIQITIENSSFLQFPKIRNLAHFWKLADRLRTNPLSFKDFLTFRCLSKEMYTFMEGRRYMMFNLTRADWDVYANLRYGDIFQPYGPRDWDPAKLERALQIFGYVHNTVHLNWCPKDILILFFKYGALDYLNAKDLNELIASCLFLCKTKPVEYLLVHGYLTPEYRNKYNSCAVTICDFHPDILSLLLKYKFDIPETHDAIERILAESDDSLDVIFQFPFSDEFLLLMYDYAYTLRDNCNDLLTMTINEMHRRGVQIPLM
jgi:hypothetical protein